MYVWGGGVKNTLCNCNFAVISIVSENEPKKLQNKTSPVLIGVIMAKLRDSRFLDNPIRPKIGPPKTLNVTPIYCLVMSFKN